MFFYTTKNTNFIGLLFGPIQSQEKPNHCSNSFGYAQKSYHNHKRTKAENDIFCLRLWLFRKFCFSSNFTHSAFPLFPLHQIENILVVL